MILDYLSAALESAHYELIEDEEPFYASVPGLEGVWATGKSLEECRRNLSSAIEDWILFSVRMGAELPPVAGVTLIVPDKVA
ncbi:MAG: type II toxin-antitoxin system HicB family antitoxin [Holophagales bacterium]|nr:type II toxin-antitoxin system HicB family antitoxin [Holophagales bacterium]